MATELGATVLDTAHRPSTEPISEQGTIQASATRLAWAGFAILAAWIGDDRGWEASSLGRLPGCIRLRRRSSLRGFVLHPQSPREPFSNSSGHLPLGAPSAGVSEVDKGGEQATGRIGTIPPRCKQKTKIS